MSIAVYVLRRKDRRDYQLCYNDPLTRRRVTRSAKTSDLKTARLEAARWQVELEDGTGKGRTTWEQFRNRFKDEHLAGLARKTRKAYLTAMNAFERLVGKPVDMSAVDSGVLSKFKGELMKQSKIGTTTIGTYLTHVMGALSWAKSASIIKVAPRVKKPKLDKDTKAMRGRPITAKEFEHLIHTAKIERKDKGDADKFVRLLHGLRFSGLRVEEAERLDWERGPVQLDLDGARHPRILLGVAGHKGRRQEILPVTPDFANFISQTPKSQRKGRVFGVNTKARRIVAAIGRASGIVVNDVDGKYVSAHDLRRTFATEWSYKVRPIILQRLMRHKDIKTTLKYYVAQEADDVGDELLRAWNVHRFVHQPAQKKKGPQKSTPKNSGKKRNVG